MSDPVSNAEIEDVLSSIRRLVSQRKAAADDEAPTLAVSPVEDVAQGGADALVLSPALRVEEDGVEDASLAGAVALPEGASDQPSDLDASPSAPFADVDGPDQHAPESTASPVAETAPLFGSTRPAASEDDPGKAGSATPSAPEQPQADAPLQSRVAGIEAALDTTGDEWEPDGSEAQHLPTEMPPQVPTSGPDAEAQTPSEDAPRPPLFRRSVADEAPEDAGTPELGDTGIVGAEALPKAAPEAGPETAPEAGPILFQSGRLSEAEDSQDAAWETVKQTSDTTVALDTAEEGAPSPSAPLPTAAEDAPEQAQTAPPTLSEAADLTDATDPEALELPPEAGAPPETPPQVSDAAQITASEPEIDTVTEVTGVDDIAAPVTETAPGETTEGPGRLHLVPPASDAKPEPEDVLAEYEIVSEGPSTPGADPWAEEADDAKLVNSPDEMEDYAAFEDSEDEDMDDVDLLADDGGAYLDEDTLREMVSEMIRAELQGALGERITRNVRKLVRREVQRALATRDFD